MMWNFRNLFRHLSPSTPLQARATTSCYSASRGSVKQLIYYLDLSILRIVKKYQHIVIVKSHKDEEFSMFREVCVSISTSFCLIISHLTSVTLPLLRSTPIISSLPNQEQQQLCPSYHSSFLHDVHDVHVECLHIHPS